MTALIPGRDLRARDVRNMDRLRRGNAAKGASIEAPEVDFGGRV